MTDVSTAVPPARPRPRGERAAPRLFVTPAVLAVAVLGAYPLVFTVAAALTDSSLGRPFRAWTGADNLALVTGDADVWASLARSVVFAVFVAAASVALGTGIAVLLHAAGARSRWLVTLILLPLITPPVIVGSLFKLIFHPGGGLLAVVLGWFGVPAAAVAPLSSTTWALPAIAVADVWEWTPLVVLLVFTALLAQDAAVLEAARLDGAHGWRLFRAITLPAIGAVIAAAFFIRLVLACKVFDLIFMMTSGGPGQATTTTSYLIYQAALREFDVGKAAAITLLLAVVVTAITLPVAALTGKLQRDHG